MRTAPVRFLNAALWPFTIWLSLTHLEEHPADDYVERTSPIVAFAFGFWVCAAGLAALWALMNPQIYSGFVVGDYVMRISGRWPNDMLGVLGVFVPALYVVGFWLFTTRDERYPR